MYNNIPLEVVDIIIDFIDYKKYHKLKFKEVLFDIKSMDDCFYGDGNLPPRIAYECWGNSNIWDTYYNRNEDYNSDNESIDSYS